MLCFLKKGDSMILCTCSKDKILTIDFSIYFKYPCKIAITPWEQGIYWTNTSDPARKPPNYLDELNIPFRILMNETGTQAWLNSFPAEIHGKLLSFELKYPGFLSSLLWFISRDQYALELFMLQPRLTWLLLFSAKRYQWEESYVNRLFQKKRINILNACGLPAKHSALNFLSKFQSSIMTVCQYFLIKKVLTTTDYSKFNHLHIITEDKVKFLQKHPKMIKSKLFTTKQPEWNWYEFIHLVEDTQRLAKDLKTDFYSRVKKCRNFRELQNLHDKLTEAENRINLLLVPKIKFSKPPIDGTENIVPIQNLYELTKEGQQQQHCVSTYQPKIIAKRYYVYKILNPERATLGIELTNHGTWKINQFVLKRNKKPSKATWIYVNNWLATYFK